MPRILLLAQALQQRGPTRLGSRRNRRAEGLR